MNFISKSSEWKCCIAIKKVCSFFFLHTYINTCKICCHKSMATENAFCFVVIFLLLYWNEDDFVYERMKLIPKVSLSFSPFFFKSVCSGVRQKESPYTSHKDKEKKKKKASTTKTTTTKKK